MENHKITLNKDTFDRIDAHLKFLTRVAFVSVPVAAFQIAAWVGAFGRWIGELLK